MPKTWMPSLPPPFPELWCWLFFFVTSFFFFSSEHDVIWYGRSLWSFRVVYLCSVPSQTVAQPTHQSSWQQKKTSCMLCKHWSVTAKMYSYVNHSKFISIADAWIIVFWRGKPDNSRNLTIPGYIPSLTSELRNHQCKMRTMSSDDPWSNEDKMNKKTTTQTITKGHGMPPCNPP